MLCQVLQDPTRSHRRNQRRIFTYHRWLRHHRSTHELVQCHQRIKGQRSCLWSHQLRFRRQGRQDGLGNSNSPSVSANKESYHFLRWRRLLILKTIFQRFIRVRCNPSRNSNLDVSSRRLRNSGLLYAYRSWNYYLNRRVCNKV